MGVTKIENFSEAQNELAMFGKIFSHPARVAIIMYLLKTRQCINSHLVEELGLAQATVSQHLKELKQIGIIQGTVEGTSINYCINPVRWEELKKRFNELFEQFNDPESCC